MLPSYRLSGAARKDLKEIAAYTFREWGEDQMRKYVREIHACCELLASQPSIGRPAECLAPGLRRFETAKHVIFYLQQSDQIAVIRILHQHMLPGPESFN